MGEVCLPFKIVVCHVRSDAKVTEQKKQEVYTARGTKHPGTPTTSTTEGQGVSCCPGVKASYQIKGLHNCQSTYSQDGSLLAASLLDSSQSRRSNLFFLPLTFLGPSVNARATVATKAH